MLLFGAIFHRDGLNCVAIVVVHDEYVVVAGRRWCDEFSGRIFRLVRILLRIRSAIAGVVAQYRWCLDRVRCDCRLRGKILRGVRWYWFGLIGGFFWFGRGGPLLWPYCGWGGIV